MQSDHADIVPGLEVMYVAVSDGNHFVGGSRWGCQFLKDCGTYVPYSFVEYLSYNYSEAPTPQLTCTILPPETHVCVKYNEIHPVSNQ